MISSPIHTVDIFKSIIHNHAEVDVRKAITAGALTDGNGNVVESMEDMELKDLDDARSTAHEILMYLPGINVHNFREVASKVENIAKLSKLTEVELTPMIGPGNAKKLVSFFKQKVM
jgi:ERCC4-type nuclease